MARRFFDAAGDSRCAQVIKLRDGSEAQCGRANTNGIVCTQHANMNKRWSCTYCGGNDENPPDHCMDCERPSNLPKTPS